MKNKIFLFILVGCLHSFAQDDLRSAIDDGDIAKAKSLVKSGAIEEIYCGKLSPAEAVSVYDKIFKQMPSESFAACPSQFSYGYGEKICANAKAVNACTEVVSFLLMEGTAGNANALEFLDKVTKSAFKNKALAKPVQVPVDTSMWFACPKKSKDKALCAERCLAQADSLNDEARKESCKVKPERFVDTTISVSRPSPFYEKLRTGLLEGYWKSPMTIAHLFAEAAGRYAKKLSIPDTSIINLAFVDRWAEKHKADSSALPGRELFRFCSAWQPKVDSLLAAKEMEARCPVFETFEDPRDGRKYKVKDINGTKWFVQNLNYAVEENSFCYDGEEENCETYGRLYLYEAALAACPTGTHLSTDEDWKKLEDYAGGASVAAEKLRSNGTDDYAFTVLFGGYINKNKIPVIMGEGAYFWTSGESGDGRGIARSLFSTDNDISSMPVEKSFSLSVRCIMDN